jgi:hypothetical protein
LAGCAPLGLDAFTLGASAGNDGEIYGTEITVRTEPSPEISRQRIPDVLRILENQQNARVPAAALEEVFNIDPDPRLMRGYAAP